MVSASFIAAIFSWLIPLIISLKRGKINITHPIIIFPLFVVFTICVPFSEYLFAWSNKFESRGLRYISTEIIHAGGGAYIRTNLYMVVSAIFYFLGCYYCNNKKLIPGPKDFITIKHLKFKRISLRFILYVLSVPVLFIPFFFFDYSRSGGYFVSQIISLIYFYPSMFAFLNLSAFLLSFIIAIPFLFLFLSKGNIFYLFLWSFMPQDFIRGRITTRILLFIGAIIIGIPLMNNMIDRRAYLGYEAISAESNLSYSFFYREYGYDSFAGDVYNTINNQKTKSVSYIASNFKEIIPASIHRLIFREEKIRMGNLVGYEIFKENKTSDAGTGFNRYFLLDFYHDLGFIGIPIISFIYGWIFLFWYKKNIKLYLKTLDRLYLLRYLTLCMISHFLVNGLLYYAIATFVGMNILIFIVQFLSRKKSLLI